MKIRFKCVIVENTHARLSTMIYQQFWEMCSCVLFLQAGPRLLQKTRCYAEMIKPYKLVVSIALSLLSSYPELCDKLFYLFLIKTVLF